jgi:hypothetical protein
MATWGEQAPSQGQMSVRAYAPAGVYELSGVVGLLVAMLVVSAATGYVAHFIAQWLYLIVLFPLVIGFAVGATGIAATKWFKIRSPLVGGAVGLVCGIAAMFCMHYCDYLTVRSEFNEMSEETRAVFQLPTAEFESAIADSSKEDTQSLRLARELMNAESFASFMDFQARQGVELKKTASSSKGGINLGYVGSYIYWLLEMGIVAFIVSRMVRRQAAEPFCGRCGQWRRPRTMGYVRAQSDQAVAHLVRGDLAAAGGLLSKDSPTEVAVVAYTCPMCQGAGEVDVKVEQSVTNKKGKTQKKSLAFVTYPQGSLGQIESAFASAPPVAPSADEAAAALDQMGRK